jgi:PEP-CTERM motif
MTRFRILAVLAAAVAATAGSARAGLLPVSVTVTPDAGNYRWTYAIVLPTDSQLRTGDYFTIYDFGGLVGGLSQPDGWTSSVSNVGPTPDRVNPTDNPNIPNLTWMYTGPTVPSGQIGLGNFWAISTFGTQTDSFFTATTHRTSDGRIDTNITETVVPVPAGPVPTVPEPATLALAALGLPFAGFALRRKKA